MRCEACNGEGAKHGLPCPDCEGSGIAYCCDEAGANPPNTWDDCNVDRAGLEQRSGVPEKVEADRQSGDHVRPDQREMARVRSEVMRRFSVTLGTLAKH